MSDKEKVAEAGAVAPGKSTSENKMAWVAMAATAVIATAPVLLKAVPEGSVIWLVVSCLVALAGVVGTYIHSRGKVKAAASIAKGLALGAAPKDPQ